MSIRDSDDLKPRLIEMRASLLQSVVDEAFASSQDGCTCIRHKAVCDDNTNIGSLVVRPRSLFICLFAYITCIVHNHRQSLCFSISPSILSVLAYLHTLGSLVVRVLVWRRAVVACSIPSRRDG